MGGLFIFDPIFTISRGIRRYSIKMTVNLEYKLVEISVNEFPVLMVVRGLRESSFEHKHSS